MLFWGTIGLFRWFSEEINTYYEARPTTSKVLSLVFACVLGLATGLVFRIGVLALSPLYRSLEGSIGRAEVVTAVCALFLLLTLTFFAAHIVQAALLRTASGRLLRLLQTLAWAGGYIAMLMPAIRAAFEYFAAPESVPEMTVVQASGAVFVLSALLFYAVMRVKRDIELDATQQRRLSESRIEFNDIAVLIPAHNEQKTLYNTLDSALGQGVSKDNIYLGSDGSTDDTVKIATASGINVLDIKVNGGKARAIQSVIDHFDLISRYKAVMILDSDSFLKPGYIDGVCAMFEDPRVSVVSPHWEPHWFDREFGLGFAGLYRAYRTRQFWLLQLALRYAQTWFATNVSFIAPGYASVYRTDVLPEIDITAENLVIEDFNMTFQIHKNRLGRIGYSRDLVGVSEDPRTLGDFIKQTKRWHLGLWQTCWSNGVWASGFWVALATLMFEFCVAALGYLLWPLLLLYAYFLPDNTLMVDIGPIQITPTLFIQIIVIYLILDYLITIIAAFATRHPSLLVYGLLFPFIKWIDSWLYLYTGVIAPFTKSDGRWTSPTRVGSS